MQKVIVLVGVPASGKTHVCDRLGTHYNVVRHDQFIRGDYIRAITKAAEGKRAVLAEAPFNAATLVAELLGEGLMVEEWLVTGDLDTIKARYAKRDGKEYPKNFETNYHRYNASVRRFRFKGNSDDVVVALRARNG